MQEDYLSAFAPGGEDDGGEMDADSVDLDDRTPPVNSNSGSRGPGPRKNVSIVESAARHLAETRGAGGVGGEGEVRPPVSNLVRKHF